jgi:hypothetical protein
MNHYYRIITDHFLIHQDHRDYNRMNYREDQAEGCAHESCQGLTVAARSNPKAKKPYSKPVMHLLSNKASASKSASNTEGATNNYNPNYGGGPS